MNKIIFLMFVFLGTQAMDDTIVLYGLTEWQNRVCLHLKKELEEYDAWPTIQLTSIPTISLDEDVVTSSSLFWRKIKEAKKNNDLSEQDKKYIKTVCTEVTAGCYYNAVHPLMRINYAAALYFGCSKENWMQERLGHMIMVEDLPVVTLMLEKGCDLNVGDSQGRTALFYAQSVAMAELLRSYGASINVVDNSGDTLLHSIFMHHVTLDPSILYQLVPYYIQHGVNPAQQNANGQSILGDIITDYSTFNTKGRQRKIRRNIIENVILVLSKGATENDVLAVGQANQQYFTMVKEAVEIYRKNTARITS